MNYVPVHTNFFQDNGKSNGNLPNTYLVPLITNEWFILRMFWIKETNNLKQIEIVSVWCEGCQSKHSIKTQYHDLGIWN